MNNQGKTKKPFVGKRVKRRPRMDKFDRPAIQPGEEEFIKSEERYRRLVERSPEMIAICSKGEYIYVNPAGVKMLGASGPEQLIGKPVLEMIHPEYREIAKERIRQLEEGQEVPLFEGKFLCLDGATLYAEVTAAPIRHPEQAMFQVFARDITERKREEQALLRIEQEATRLAQENAIFAEIGRIISSTLNLDEVYEKFAATVKKIIPFDRINITLINPEAGTVTTAYISGVDVADLPLGNIIPLAGSFTQEIARTRKSMLMNAENRHEFTDRFPSLLKTYQAGLRSGISVPLYSKDQVIGALHLRSLAPNAYTDVDVALAEKVGMQIAGAIASAQFFQERERAVEALREREERYRSILETMEEGYYEVDLKGDFTFFNDALRKMHGLDKHEMLGMSNRQYMNEETAKKVYKIFNQVYKTGQPGKISEWEIIRRDGEKAVMEGSVYLIQNAQGEPIGFRGIVRDITERKQMEEALREREERFRQVAENAGEWIWETDVNGLYTYASPGVEKILAYTPEEIVGKKYFYDFFSPEVSEELKKASFKSFKNREAIRNFVNLNFHKDGHLVYLETNAAPIVDGQGNLLGYRGADTDISERKRAGEEREKLIHELQDALANIKILRGMLPICASCKKIRDDKGYWNQLESYIRDRSEAEFSHSICPECKKKLYPELFGELKESGS